MSEIIIGAKGVQSLFWDGDLLVDLLGHARKFHLCGKIESIGVSYSFRFDAVKISPSGRFSVLYEKLGTKALLLDKGKILRELNRSYYWADAYEYPLAFVQLANGRDAIVHCPDEYCRLEIEDAETGERVGRQDNRKTVDNFYSRLAVSANGKWLSSCGWLWHPMDIINVWSVDKILRDIKLLDSSGIGLGSLGYKEVVSAVFLNEERIALCLGEDLDAEGEDEVVQYELRVIDLLSGTSVTSSMIERPTGTMHFVADSQVLCLFEYPRLIDVYTGREIREWPQLNTGTQKSSILLGEAKIPPVAVHPTLPLFAVADDDKITVVDFRQPS